MISDGQNFTNLLGEHAPPDPLACHVPVAHNNTYAPNTLDKNLSFGAPAGLQETIYFTYVYSSVSSTITATFSVASLVSSALFSTCFFTVSCKAANATATSRARAFEMDQSLYDNHVRYSRTCPHLVIWIYIAKP